MTTSTLTPKLSKPKVLRIGKIDFAHEKWAQLAEVAEIVDCDSPNRQQFFQDLKTKYSDVVSVARTFYSVEQTGRFDSELISHFPDSVRSVSHTGAGYDQVDVEPLTDRGIQLSNVTVPVEAPTADTAVYLLLSTLRNFQIGHNLAVKGQWPTAKCGGAALGHLPESQTVGILGMGGIGRAIRDRLKPFGFKKIIYYNRKQLTPELEAGADYVSYDELISQSDIICISIPLNANTRHSINKEVISKMKDGIILINTARGAVINESELLHALKDGKIGAFGSDVFEYEPQVPQELLDLPNVVSLPHMGTHAVEAMKNMEEFVVDNILQFLHTGKVKTIVPEQYNMNIAWEPLVKK